MNKRKVFWAWNNLSDFEKQQLQNLKEYMVREGVIIPEGYKDRDLLKFMQGERFNIPVVSEKLKNHFIWLEALPIARTLTQIHLKILQTGCLYLFGRDKFLRPTCILNCRILGDLANEYPGEQSAQAFTDAFLFLNEYANKVMLLPGHIEQWIMLLDLGNLSMTGLPRANIMSFGKMSQAHL